VVLAEAIIDRLVVSHKNQPAWRAAATESARPGSPSPSRTALLAGDLLGSREPSGRHESGPDEEIWLVVGVDYDEAHLALQQALPELEPCVERLVAGWGDFGGQPPGQYIVFGDMTRPC
jgi:hypothetical protein